DIYSPLNSTKREIRLCRILPFSFSQECVSCVLSTVSLDAAPDFEALSYVWGDAADRVPIIVNGQRLLATKNLEAAMRALSSRAMMGFGASRDFTRVVWIDALCIDQTNLAERASQVKLMGDIYSSARHVVTWLGAE
ncbi:heterokaryon incompatibility protein-domain-containing protein, partial [Cercophora newfieldiana]